MALVLLWIIMIAKTVFSSIDKFGRYSYSNQPKITKWNLARFAECLIPLIDKDEDLQSRKHLK